MGFCLYSQHAHALVRFCLTSTIEFLEIHPTYNTPIPTYITFIVG
jgi:hypothetical protein